MFFIIEKSEQTTFLQNSASIVWFLIMETQKVANLLGNSDNESLKIATRKWYAIND